MLKNQNLMHPKAAKLATPMLYSDNDVTHNYNAKDNTESNWSTAYFHCGPCPNEMTSKFHIK